MSKQQSICGSIHLGDSFIEVKEWKIKKTKEKRKKNTEFMFKVKITFLA